MRVIYIYDQSFHPAIADIVIALENAGILRRSETEDKPWVGNVADIIKNLPVPELPPAAPGYLRYSYSNKKEGVPIAPLEDIPGRLDLRQEDNTPCIAGVEIFLNNHQPIENNFETIAKENLGICEPKKDFIKELKAAVKEHGHDVLIEAFYNWTTSIGTFMGRKPVTAFLKNPSSHIGSVRVKPQVTNPTLSKVEERIAYISDNKVFFTGDYRIKLAGLLKDFGPELVVTAFEDFFQDLDEKGIQWAAREFLQRAPVMITIIQRKRTEAESAAKLQAAAMAAAKEAVEEPVEEEDEGEL